MAAYERQVRAAERQAELEHWSELNTQMLALAFVHEDEFPDATPPQGPRPEAVDEVEVLSRHTRAQLAGISILKRGQRREARARAGEAAAEEIERETRRREGERQALQALLDEHWRDLVANNPEAVHDAIENAFEDDEMPAAVIDVRGASATDADEDWRPGRTCS